MNNVVVGHVSKQQKAHIHVKRPSNPVKSQDLSSRKVYKLFPFEGGAEFILLKFPCFFQRQKEREFVYKVTIYI